MTNTLAPVCVTELKEQRPPEAGTVSVLMSTYVAEDPGNLAASLESVYTQTIRPDQLVLVVDGPVGKAQEEIISRFSSDWRVARFTAIRLTKNGGLAHALNAGLAACTCEFVMRMDSDDLCMPDRLETQLAYALAHPQIDVLSSWCEEFSGDGLPNRLKVSPTTHDAICRALRWRNVLVHPTIFIRAEALRRIGGYRAEFDKLEDYDLFIRLFLSGARFHAIPKVLVKFRTSPAQMERRGGLSYWANELRFRRGALRAGFLNFREFVVTTSLYSLFRLVSGPIRRRFYALSRVATSEPSDGPREWAGP